MQPKHMRFSRTILLALLALIVVAAANAQTKRRTQTDAKKPVATAPTQTPVVDAPEPVVMKPEPKKNERPTHANSTVEPTPTVSDPTYFYEFSQPDFDISNIVIEHDDSGKGTIKFTKKLFSDTVTDPIQVSPAALERINAAYTTLNFLSSTDSYQYEKDYSHLGVMTFRLKRDAKQRSTTFNYTVNKDAKVLADEYRKLSNQYVWVFDITVARENQTLNAPRLLDSLDSLIRRNEISDPSQMVPLLKELSNDERIPLIARNHAGKLVDRITQKKK